MKSEDCFVTVFLAMTSWINLEKEEGDLRKKRMGLI